MTTSPPPSGNPAPVQDAAVLSDERASSIGWYFIVSYYDFYNTNIDNIHKIYHQHAAISHDAFPEGPLETSTDSDKDTTKTIHKAQGTEAIKARFKIEADQKTANRIVVTSAAFEVSLNKNILIVVFGEWSKNDSPYHQFTQTFVLTPGKKENTFDVANDILKFIDFGEFKSTTKTVEKSIKVEEKTTEVPVSASVSNGDVPAVTKDVSSAPAEEIVSPTPEDAAPQEPEADVAEEEETVEDDDEGAKEFSPADSEDFKKDSEDESPSKAPAQPLSWAALASQAAPVKTKPVPSPGLGKPTPSPVKKAATAAAAAAAATAGGKFKKEEWFPIYIRGVRSLDEKALREHISKNFGELKFFKTSSNIALCDFVTVDAQQKALESRETVIDGITIQLEPRESKTGNNYHNGNKKVFKDQKEKPNGGAEVKRNRSDKKIASGKKTNRTASRSD
ncbi:uncharacterized protein RJT20DRAFT_26090 [Scheffersomyces xylosifermentans]|uniref:uncharacterized protein n=1 Tax=Scheffersomyces xylosifermentans TaxID=1304137 RepID=UPI00315DBD67